MVVFLSSFKMIRNKLVNNTKQINGINNFFYYLKSILLCPRQESYSQRNGINRHYAAKAESTHV